MSCAHTPVERYSLLETPLLPFNEYGNLYYFINNYSDKMPMDAQKAMITAAFDEWNYELNAYEKRFIYTENADLAYLKISFVGGNSKIQLPKEIVSVLDDVNVLAFHHTGTGNIYVSDNNDWADKSIDLRYSIIHEIGHAIGLAHTSRHDDIMYSMYIKYNKITSDTRDGIKKIFNKPIFNLASIRLIDAVIVFALLYLIYYFTFSN